MLRKWGLALAMTVGLAAPFGSAAHAAMLSDGLDTSGVATPLVEKAQFGLIPFLFGGRQYCWYDGGWRGPGWYWCGYANRQGLGWGGGDGWQGRFHGGRGGGGRPGFGHGGGRPGFGHGGGRPGGGRPGGGGGHGGGRPGGGGGHGGGHGGGGGHRH